MTGFGDGGLSSRRIPPGLPVCSGCTWPRSTSLDTRGCTHGDRGRCSPSPRHTRTARGTRESDTCRDRSACHIPATTYPTMENTATSHATTQGADWRRASFRDHSPKSCPAPVKNAYNPNQPGANMHVPGVPLGSGSVPRVGHMPPVCSGNFYLAPSEPFFMLRILYLFSCTFGKIYAAHEPHISQILLLKTKLDLRHLKSI